MSFSQRCQGRLKIARSLPKITYWVFLADYMLYAIEIQRFDPFDWITAVRFYCNRIVTPVHQYRTGENWEFAWISAHLSEIWSLWSVFFNSKSLRSLSRDTKEQSYEDSSGLTWSAAQPVSVSVVLLRTYRKLQEMTLQAFCPSQSPNIHSLF